MSREPWSFIATSWASRSIGSTGSSRPAPVCATVARRRGASPQRASRRRDVRRAHPYRNARTERLPGFPDDEALSICAARVQNQEWANAACRSPTLRQRRNVLRAPRLGVTSTLVPYGGAARARTESTRVMGFATLGRAFSIGLIAVVLALTPAGAIRSPQACRQRSTAQP